MLALSNCSVVRIVYLVFDIYLNVAGRLLPDGSTAPLPFAVESTEALAKEEQDFRMETNIVSFQAGQSETEVILVILDDSEPEGQEVFFVYLSDPEGGAQITDSPNQGFGAFAKITILGNCLPSSKETS